MYSARGAADCPIASCSCASSAMTRMVPPGWPQRAHQAVSQCGTAIVYTSRVAVGKLSSTNSSRKRVICACSGPQPWPSRCSSPDCGRKEGLSGRCVSLLERHGCWGRGRWHVYRVTWCARAEAMPASVDQPYTVRRGIPRKAGLPPRRWLAELLAAGHRCRYPLPSPIPYELSPLRTCASATRLRWEQDGVAATRQAAAGRPGCCYCNPSARSPHLRALGQCKPRPQLRSWRPREGVVAAQHGGRQAGEVVRHEHVELREGAPAGKCGKRD